MKTILVPTDFSNAAQNATDVAASIARRSKAELVLLHVVEDIEEGSFNVEGEAAASGSWEDKIFTAKMIQKSKQQLTNVASALIESGVNVKQLLRVGTPYHGIQAIITENKADLVVMGINGTSRAEEILIGSNTEKVVRRSSCPVLSVNNKPSGFDFKSIVYAVSLKTDELSIPPMVKDMQQLYGSTIHIVRINTPGLFMNDKVAKDKLDEFAKFLKLKDFTVNIYNDFNEDSGIINFAESVDADMISMWTHGRTGLAHVLNGSIAESVSSHSKRCVLTSVLPKM
jgi:nucleotide-binding universal stress UspA family protein